MTILQGGIFKKQTSLRNGKKFPILVSCNLRNSCMSNHSDSQSIWPGLTTSPSPRNLRNTNLEPKLEIAN